MISTFELPIVTIVNSNPHKILDSSILNSNGTTFCSQGVDYDETTFCFPIVCSNETTFFFWASKLPTFFSFLPLAITTFNIQKTTISLLILKFNGLNQKDQIRRKKRKRKKVVACCHHFLHNTTTITIEEGDDIVAVTFFVVKPLKKATIVAITFFCSKAIEEGVGSCHRLFFLLKHREEGNGSFLPSPSLLQQ